ncbi:purine-nucleoside phosphorylase [Paenibacillus oceani]|uniref:Purine nucleoside phosphorylase n=1 Tax=Paenibacillus oceani TaxID=2772510 RepID=A0A927C504_9BACL|nr:purine-nucleoside phosphorylase [Paenibacillus oceani]MBD2861390.1 purine-nucleoside phosphorylase [Paenibacillus oceani]
MELTYVDQINQAAAYIRGRIAGREPVVGLVLGSGLGDLASEVEDAITIDFSEVPHFPVSTVEGHAGRFVIGTLEGKTVIVMQGRFHYYEGYPMRKVAAPIYVMRKLGVQTAVITNAAGGMNRAFRPGDLMLICDHLNMTGDNPLIGTNDAGLGVRFPDMSEAYNKSYRELAHRLSSLIRSDDGDSLELQEGVYCGISGPPYMTPAELKMLARLGGDAVGMSTVAEVIAARHCGLEVLGISCITDMAIGEELEPLSHEQVMEVANRTKPRFTLLVKSFVRAVPV